MTPKITEEQRQAIEAHPGEPVRVEDDKTHRTYILVEESQAPQLYERWLCHKLEEGFAAADCGELVEWAPTALRPRVAAGRGEWRRDSAES